MKLLLPEALVIVVLTQVGFPTLNGPYLGQKRPGQTPEIFAPGILSLGFHEHNIAISPDGKEVFFTAASSDFSRYLIMTTKLKKNVWSMPEVAPFSGGRHDGAPAFSPDGKRLYFSSRRPRPAGGTSAEDFDIWYVERKGDSWTDPMNLGGPVNTGQNEVNPSVTADGTIYFQRIEKLGTLDWDLYMSSPKDGVYGLPEKLPEPVNTEANEAGPFIAPDGSYLLFQSNRAGGYGIMDLYVAYRAENGGWSDPQNLGDKINSSFSDWGPVVSPDGEYLFFSSFRNVQPLTPESPEYYAYMTSRLGAPTPGKGTLYWVKAAAITTAARGQMSDEYQRVSVNDMTSREQLVDVEGRKISCTVYGQGAPTVVLISGFQAGQSYWNSVVPGLIDKATIITYDRPGIGKSEKGHLPLHAGQSAKDLLTLLKKTEVPRPYIIVGHSMGTDIARLFTSMYPEDVGGLILEDGSHESLLNEQLKILKGKDLQVLQEMASKTSHPENPQNEADYRKETIEQLRNSAPLPRIPYVVLTSGDRSKALPPVFSEQARKDLIMLGIDLQRRLVDLIPGGKHIIAEGVGHNIHVEKPAILVDPIVEMINKINASRPIQ